MDGLLMAAATLDVTDAAAKTAQRTWDNDRAVGS